MTIKVLIVDDSALIRSLLSTIVSAEPDMTLIGAAPDAYAARELVNRFSPDVITLDIEMPKVDGLTFLDKLMKARPTPVLMISTLTEQGAEATIRALELGAVDYIAKPKLGVAEGIREFQTLITDKIRIASKANVKRAQKSRSVVNNNYPILGTEKIIAIGASTGGTEAIKLVLMSFPANCPAVVVTQHMPPGFTTSFAKRLDSLCNISVKEGEHGERILPGCAYIAPGDYHMKIVRSGTDYRIHLDNSQRVSGHKPSVNVMFESLAECAGKNIVAVLLTGMGKDGASGLLNIKQAQGYTFVQDEESCVVFGMPREAILLGAETEILPLEDIAEAILKQLVKSKAGSRL
ncbi:chemotaxis response regulator protein-glutamate methylesterase [Paraglaciecola sp.]|uniref:protein-glutamate methylesterase/protein-glutamine glutaminase n=1 Tax=Paraglaciecola sp. TaxID=1920173 RepID=UPI0030F39E5A